MMKFPRKWELNNQREFKHFEVLNPLHPHISEVHSTRTTTVVEGCISC